MPKRGEGKVVASNDAQIAMVTPKKGRKPTKRNLSPDLNECSDNEPVSKNTRKAKNTDSSTNIAEGSNNNAQLDEEPVVGTAKSLIQSIKKKRAKTSTERSPLLGKQNKSSYEEVMPHSSNTEPPSKVTKSTKRRKDRYDDDDGIELVTRSKIGNKESDEMSNYSEDSEEDPELEKLDLPVRQKKFYDSTSEEEQLDYSDVEQSTSAPSGTESCSTTDSGELSSTSEDEETEYV